MKLLVPGKLLLPAVVLTLAPAMVRAENIAQCFSVREMVKTEAARYGVHALSRCSRTYDAVYVAVSFLDRRGNQLADGVWAIYWARPGRVEIQEFGIPQAAVGFERVVLRKITTDFSEALNRPVGNTAVASRSPEREISTGSGRVIGDPGPRGAAR